MGVFEVKECDDTEVIKVLFQEYSQIKGAESCFVSFDKELANLKEFYKDGALLVGYEDEKPIACIAVKKIDDNTCEAKRLFIKPEYRGKGYARTMLNTMLDKANELGFNEVTFTTKPSVMQIGYGLYKRMGFEEIAEKDGIVSMRMAIMMDKKIVKFLIKAKRATYAGKGTETTSSREKSHDLIYRDGEYMYYDTYLGTGKFAGEEALWINDNPYWSMNYIGRVIGENFSGDFLKEALLLVPEDKPFRGPEEYVNGDYSYQCEINGDFEWFQGKEIICYKNKQVYECVFHGGLVE